MKNYLSGNWSDACEYFEKTNELHPNKNDGPSKTLIKLIQSYQKEAPVNWQGFRELTEK